jgi:Flp pilus assembly protein TadG
MMDELQLMAAGRRNGIRRAARRKERGSTLLEYGLVIAMMVIVMVAIIEFGQALYTYHFVSNAAREATRWASVRSLTTNLPGGAATKGNVQQTFASAASLAGMGLDHHQITIDTTWIAPPTPTPKCTPPANKPGCVVQVNVTYSYNFFFPFLPTSPVIMTSTSQMVITQ